MKNLITIENTGDVIKEIEEAFFDIPFENSQFQTEHFVINAALTPQRAYRAIGLRMNNRLRALREAQFSRMREDIDMEELRAKADDQTVSKYDRRRAEIDILQKLSNRAFTEKLINDALAELNVLYAHFKRLPRFTREEFEVAEQTYFRESLTRQVSGVVGANESLTNMNVTTPAITANEAKELGNGT